MLTWSKIKKKRDAGRRDSTKKIRKCFIKDINKCWKDTKCFRRLDELQFR